MKRTRLKSLSDRKRDLREQYLAVKTLIVPLWKRCARCQLATDNLEAHHPFKRSNGRRDEWKELVVIPLCHSCHTAVHANENQARSDGWLVTTRTSSPYAEA